MIAAVPNRSRIRSSVSSSSRTRSNGSRSWIAALIAQVRQRDPDQRQAAPRDQRHREPQQLRRAREDRVGLAGRLEHRRGAGDPREVGEPQPEHDRPAHPARRPQPPRDAIDQDHQHRRRAPRRAAVAVRAPAAPRSSADVRARARGAGHGCAPAHAGGDPTRGRASPRARASSSSATWPTVVIPRARSFAAVTRPTPHNRSTGSGCRNAQLLAGLRRRAARRAWHRARDLREELRPRDADRDRQPDLLADLAPQPDRDLGRRPEMCSSPRTSRNASSIDSPSTTGADRSNTANTALLASLYADIRGGTTTARGHSRRACAPPIAVLHAATPWPRSSPRARPRRRRSPAGRAAADRPAARPTRRTSRGRRGGSWLGLTRTYVLRALG